MTDEARRARRRAHNAHALERCNAMGRTAGSILWQPLQKRDGKWFMPDGATLPEPPIEWRSEKLETILDEMDAREAVAPAADWGKAYVETLDVEKWKAETEAQFVDGGAVRLDIVETYTPGPGDSPYGWTEIALVKTVTAGDVLSKFAAHVESGGSVNDAISLEDLEKAIMDDPKPTPPIPTTLDASTFEYLKPTDAQVETMGMLRHAALEYAATLDANIPPGPDKTYLLRKLREVAMWVNIAITRNADGSPRP